MFSDPSCAGGTNAVKNVAAEVQQSQANQAMAGNNTAEGMPQEATEGAVNQPGNFMSAWNGGDAGLTAEQEEELARAFEDTDMSGMMGQMPENVEDWMEQYASQMQEMGMGSGIGFNDPPPAPTYTACAENRYAGQVVPLQQGVDAFHRGELQEAIQMLETTAQAQDSAEAVSERSNPRDPASLIWCGQGEAWRWLGMAHAETDDDRQAIAALLKAVETDANNLDALLVGIMTPPTAPLAQSVPQELGVSCTNELDQNQVSH